MMSSSSSSSYQQHQEQQQQLPQPMEMKLTSLLVEEVHEEAISSSSTNATTTASMIIDCNNRGTQLIRYGQYDLAIPILSDGLTTVKKASNNAQQQSRNKANMITDMDEWFTQLIMESASKRSTTATQASQSSQSSQHEYVYQHPIDLDVTDVMCTSSLGVQCMVLMYNMALAFHMNSLTESEEDVEEQICMTRNAIEMYEICYEVMSTENINPGLHFIMILANNLGQSHLLIGNYEKAQQCLEHLLSLQMYVMDSTLGNKKQQHQHMRGNDEPEDEQHQEQLQPWDGFLSNTSMLILSNCCASAA